MNWMIYPVTKTFIKACSAIFGISITSIVFIHIFTPLLAQISLINKLIPQLVILWMELLAILSMACLVLWGGRVLLASQGNYITRNLSMLTILPALYALLIPFAEMAIPVQYGEMERVWEAFLVLIAIIVFFAYPFTAGYTQKDRKLFLVWGITATCCGLQRVLFELSEQVLLKIPSFSRLFIIFLFYALEITLAVLSIKLACRLFNQVMNIISMPEALHPSVINKRD